jgi:hypothetical protein
VIELQQMLPMARVVYCSATGVSEVGNMAYMTRMGLWGAGTPFAGEGSGAGCWGAPAAAGRRALWSRAGPGGGRCLSCCFKEGLKQRPSPSLAPAPHPHPHLRPALALPPLGPSP